MVDGHPVFEKVRSYGVMAMQCSLQSNQVKNLEVYESAVNFIEPKAVIASPCWNTAECDSNLLVTRPSSVCLNLEDLKCFEIVEYQFQHCGISFKNAIALQPSNPAYPPRSSPTVLMGAPKTGWLEVICQQPIRMFCCYVTSSQRTILSAYNHQDKLLVRKSMTKQNLAGSDSPIPPNAQLMIEEANISRITFYAFDGQLTLADLSFGF